MITYSLKNVDRRMQFFEQIKEDYLYNFSLSLNKPLIGPHMLQLLLTTRCNLKCKMCGVWATKEREVDTFAIKKVIDDAYKLGNLKVVYFTGGEVLLRPDIFNLIKYVHDYYPSVLTHFNTNGLLLTRENIDKIFEVKLGALGISIDSPVAKVHNSLRGEGVFEKIIEALNYINSEKARRGVSYPLVSPCSVLMEPTLDSMYDMLDFCVEHKMSGISIQPYVCNTDLRERKENKFWIQEDRLPDLKRVLKKIDAKKGELPLHIDLPADKIYNYFAKPMYVDNCYAGFTRALVVGHKICFVCNGPNDNEHQHFGEVETDSLADAWFSKEADAFRKTIKKCRQNCVQFCSIRPSSDSLQDIHRRLFETNNVYTKYMVYMQTYLDRLQPGIKKHIITKLNKWLLKISNQLFQQWTIANMFLVFRELQFLEQTKQKYPKLPLASLINEDYMFVLNHLNDFLHVVSGMDLKQYPADKIEHYLLADLGIIEKVLKNKRQDNMHKMVDVRRLEQVMQKVSCYLESLTADRREVA